MRSKFGSKKHWGLKRLLYWSYVEPALRLSHDYLQLWGKQIIKRKK